MFDINLFLLVKFSYSTLSNPELHLSACKGLSIHVSFRRDMCNYLMHQH